MSSNSSDEHCIHRNNIISRQQLPCIPNLHWRN